jgi:predicted signal transduction protein with EAL and GGDEF domain
MSSFSGLCEESTCRGGLACCASDPLLGAYCISDTFCNASTPLWETIFIFCLLVAMTVGVGVVVWWRARRMRLRPFSMADFVER